MRQADQVEPAAQDSPPKRARTAPTGGQGALRSRSGPQIGATAAPRGAGPAAAAGSASASAGAGPANAGPHAKEIGDALRKTAGDPNARFLAVGYSPTGGGHTGRTLNIVERALNAGHLKKGDTVIFHAPRPWLHHPRAAGLDDLAQKLKDKEITVVMAEADKSVMGYLKPEGASDDPRILDGIAHTPKRPTAAKKSVLDAKVFRQKNDFQSLPSISAVDLMASIKGIVGEDAMRSKFKILTDMDPALQKAAGENGVPGEQRVDQQNHAILLDLNNPAANLHPRNAHLAKVLGGTGELVSHIGLGDKNTLTAMTTLASKLQLTETSSKTEARNAVAGYLLEHGKKDRVGPGQNFQGVIHDESIKRGEDAKNIVYVYAHNFTPEIEARVRARIDAHDPDYKDSLFVFCGGSAVKGANAMHLAYLADGDGITTAGAGTNGEFAYLHKTEAAKGGLMVLPIAGHNEQNVNAEVLASDDATAEFVVNHAGAGDVGGGVDAYMRQRAQAAPAKYAQADMSKMLPAVADPSDYAQQAVDMLFGVQSDAADTARRASAPIAATEKAMRDSPVLTANRRFDKLALQVLGKLEADIQGTGGRPSRSLDISLKRKEEAGAQLHFNSMKDLTAQLADDQQLTKLLQSDVPLNAQNVLLLGETRQLFNDYLRGADNMAQKIGDLKEKLGHQRTTGF
jgi:hypothetical protein